MKLIFLTTNDPLYLPDFFERVLSEEAGRVAAVYAAPPLYKNESAVAAALKYLRTFGLADTARLSARILRSKLQGRSIASVCRSRGIPYREVADVNAPSFLRELEQQGPDALVSVSCPQIFKERLIALPPRGILNIHGAILPQYRGVMPSFWMMANGEKQAGVSIYFVNRRIDAGDLCARKIFDIDPRETLDHFLRRSKAIAADLLLRVIRLMECGEVSRLPLNLAEGSYYSWPDAEAVRRFRALGRRLW